MTARLASTTAIDMRKATWLRLGGGAIILFNLWLIGQYKIEGIAVLLLTKSCVALATRSCPH